jgi:hypothetical protein
MPIARATGTLALGALALHELRYLLASEPGLDAHGAHAYMAQAVPVIVVLATALLATVLLASLSGRAPRPGRLSRRARAALYAGLLLGLFWTQELAEAMSSGHVWAGVDALVGSGGWIALPLALALGSIAALATHGLEGVEQRIAAAQWAPRPRRTVRSGPRALTGVRLRPLVADALAFGIARRPPPAALRV